MTAAIIHTDAFLYRRIEADCERIRNPNAIAVVRTKASTDSKRRNIEAVLDKQARDMRDMLPSDSEFRDGA